VGRAANHPQPEGDAGLQEEEVIVKDQLNAEEREILEKFERDELQPATGVDRETAIAPEQLLGLRAEYVPAGQGRSRDRW